MSLRQFGCMILQYKYIWLLYRDYGPFHALSHSILLYTLTTWLGGGYSELSVHQCYFPSGLTNHINL